MSRSRRKTPIIGNCNIASEKKDKKILHGKMRTAERIRLHKLDETIDDDIFPVEDELRNKWAMQKDGKSYMHNNDRWREKEMRK